MAIRKVEHAAPRKQCLTLDDVASWVQDAVRSGAKGGEIVVAAVSIGGKLQKISVIVETTEIRDATPRGPSE